MIFYKIFGALLMLSFIALLRGLGTAATELPVGEGWEEEDFDDLPQYRVENEEWMPVKLERQNGTN
jgi:hypothetical protein